MQEKLLNSINKRLGTIIALISRLKIRESEILTLRSQIRILSDLGLTPKEIADILGRSNKYISKELSKTRKKNKK